MGIKLTLLSAFFACLFLMSFKGEKKKKERTEKREATTTQPQQAQPDSIRTIQTAQKPLTPPK